MRTLFGLGLGLLACVVSVAGSGAVAEAPTKIRNYEVRMVKDHKFDPAEIEIQVGDTITWINQTGAAHTATPDMNGDFPSQSVAGGKFSPRVPFPKEAIISYHCIPHQDAGMVGKIIVKKVAP